MLGELQKQVAHLFWFQDCMHHSIHWWEGGMEGCARTRVHGMQCRVMHAFRGKRANWEF